MKIKILFVALLLATAAPVIAGQTASNSVPRCCCAAAPAPAKPLAEKSLYQLDTVWTNDDGVAVPLSSLRGRPQVIVMFFASCQYTCPLTVMQMKELETALPASARANVGFTLVSFDTLRDTPATLKSYRALHELPRGNWTLLTGSADSVLDLAALLGVKFKEDAQGQFSHSNVITLLNAEGEIAYQQVGLNPDNQELIRHLAQLGIH